MSTTGAHPPIPTPDLGLTIGAALIGLVFSAILFGITNLQTYIYYKEYPNDWKLYQYSVGLLWALDALHLALTTHAVYHYLVESFGNFLALDVVIWSFKVQIIVNVVIIVAVQSLYAIRLWKLGRHFHKLLPWLVFVVVLGGTVVGILLAYETCRLSRFSAIQEIAWAVDASFAAATAIDFMIAFSMCFYLQKTKRGSEFSSTNSKIVILMRFVLISGLATSACSTVALVTFIVMPGKLVFLGIEFLLTKLYVNSFLSMLNARKRIAGAGGAETSSAGSKVLRINTSGNLSASAADRENKSFFPLSELSPADGKWHDPEAATRVGFAA